MLETQPDWHTPSPRTLGWHIGLWNLIGALGFTLCGALGFASGSSGACEKASLWATFIGSWAFLVRTLHTSTASTARSFRSFRLFIHTVPTYLPVYPSSPRPTQCAQFLVSLPLSLPVYYYQSRKIYPQVETGRGAQSS